MKCEQKPVQDPAFSRYAADTMLPLLQSLQQELSGVRTADDIEYVHRTRVATRRLRACLTIFSPSLPPEKVKIWRRTIRDITRSLGEARDLDVQIDFISTFISKYIQNNYQRELFFYSSPMPDHHPLFSIKQAEYEENNIEDNNEEPGSEPFLYCSGQFDIHRPGLECLLHRLKARRHRIQPDLVKAADRLEETGIPESMTSFLHELKIRAEIEGGTGNSPFSYEQAFVSIMTAISDLFWFEPWLSEPDNIHQHHEMRIAAKRLRYTLESFSDLYECGLKSEIKTFKSLQDVLGDMHDCDVWIERIPAFILEEEKRADRYFGNPDFFSILERGLNKLLENRKKKREELFSELHVMWDTIKEEGFWDRLMEKISYPVRLSSQEKTDQNNEEPVTIALISDIHANLPALEAVLTDAKLKGATAILNAGDSIGYGAFPDEVISCLRSSHVLSVIGNYDLAVLFRKWKRGKPRSRDKQAVMQFAYNNLSKENRTYLAGLSREFRLRVRGTSILVTHGSPDSINEYLDLGTPESRLREFAQKTRADIIVTGHSHLPSIRQVDNVLFVNCGSVGRTEDGDPRACYALLTLDPLSVVHIRVSYDISRAITAMQNQHLPGPLTRIVSEGRSPDDISGHGNSA